MIQKNDKVADVVTKYPKTADIFRQYGIDFCCGGQIEISKAIDTNKKIDLSTLLSELESASLVQSEGIDLQYLTIPSLIQYIQSRYHQTLIEEFNQLTPYITKLARVHGSNYPYLQELKKIYQTFKEAMLIHTTEEDHESFPKLIQAHKGEQVDNLNKVIESLVEDHEGAGALLSKMRELTNDYEPPVEACGTWRLVYQRLEVLEKETHQHVHLENNVLFPKLIS